MADNRMNDETSFHHSDMPILCSSGCGFFGSATMMNLCSKCYRDRQLKEDREALARVAFKLSVNPPPSVTSVVQEKSTESVRVSSEKEGETEKQAVKVAPSRCGSCKKKVGMLGFKCRCGVTFCGSHRYPEEHDCQVDYKTAGKEAIAKANPLIVADKLTTF